MDGREIHGHLLEDALHGGAAAASQNNSTGNSTEQEQSRGGDGVARATGKRSCAWPTLSLMSRLSAHSLLMPCPALSALAALCCRQGVGLANTLFGLLAALTFCVILHIVYTNRRRARSSANDPSALSRATSDAMSGRDGFGSSSRRRGGSNDSRGSFAALGESYSSSSVSFSSYVKFLNVSSFWALLWVVFNLFPQVSSGRDAPTLIWHAVVASLVYTASVFLELAVVVFLLNEGVGQRAFRNSAMVTGCLSIVYGSANLYFRLGFDIALARRWDDYPIAQLDFISTKETMVFLGVSSLMFAAFFLYTSGSVQWAQKRSRARKKDAAGTGAATAGAATTSNNGYHSSSQHAKQRRKSQQTQRQQSEQSLLTTPIKGGGSGGGDNLLPPTGYGSNATWAEASSPLITSASLISAGRADGHATSPQLKASLLGVATASTTPPAGGYVPVDAALMAPGGSDERVDRQGSPTAPMVPSELEDLHNEIAVGIGGGSGGSGGSGGNGGRDSPSQHLSSPAGTGVGAAGSPRFSIQPPQRRSVVAYSLFLSCYYFLKTTGLALLYFRSEVGICFLDGGILLYMLVYAFLLYWTLVQDIKYWHELLASVQVHQQDEAKKGGEEERLLTGDSAASTSPRGGQRNGSSPPGAATGKSGKSGAVSPSRGSMQLKSKLLESGHSSRSTSRDDSSLFALPPSALKGGVLEGSDRVVASSSFLASSPTSSRQSRSGSSGAHLRSASVLLKDYIIPPNQLVLIKPLEIPEMVSSSSAAANAGGASGRSGLGRNKRGGGSKRDSPLSTPALSRSGSGTGPSLGMAMSAPSRWQDRLAGASSRALRVVAGGWTDRSCSLYLARWKGQHNVVVKQFTLPTLTTDFFTKHFNAFISQIPMGLWIGCAAAQADNLALCLGVSVDPPCISIVFEWGALGTLYDVLHPLASSAAAGTGSSAAAAGASTPNDMQPADGNYHALSGALASPNPHNSDALMSPRMARASSIGGSTSVPGTPGHSLGAGPGVPLVSGPHLFALLDPYRLALEIASAMAHLQRWSGYDAHPLHLSPACIMLDESLHAKIADFGDYHESVALNRSDRASHGSNRKRAHNLSQAAWQSPEVLGGGAPTKSSAVYSFGMVLWGLLTRQYPCVSVPCEEVAATSAAASGYAVTRGVRAPSPSRSASSSYSASQSYSQQSTFAPSILKSTGRSAAVLASPPKIGSAVASPQPLVPAADRDGLLSPLATNLRNGASHPSDSASSSLGVADHRAITIDGGAGSSAGADDDEEDTPPSTPPPALPSISDPNDDAYDPPPVSYECVRLSSLKVTQQFILVENRRPPLPLGLPPAVSHLLTLCWDENPDDRPSFEIIVEYLQEQCGELAHLQLPLAISDASSSSAAFVDPPPHLSYQSSVSPPSSGVSPNPRPW